MPEYGTIMVVVWTTWSILCSGQFRIVVVARNGRETAAAHVGDQDGDLDWLGDLGAFDHEVCLVRSTWPPLYCKQRREGTSDVK